MALLGTDDKINMAMLNGLKQAFKKDIKDLLMSVAEKKAEHVAESLCQRIDINSKTWLAFETQDRHIKLEWLIKKEGLE